MRVPGKIRKVKPGEIVVFEKSVHLGSGDFNALCQNEDESLIFFDTAHYETNATPVFYNDRGVETVLGYNKDHLKFAYELNRAGITPHELKEYMHDFEWVINIVRKENQRILDDAIKSSLGDYHAGGD